ncbi:MAG: hypothetical protein CMD39_12190 [Gammaproteobacteria bacterium]|nr:hypothetical protein [Gammaproteobacteria bacterium]|tara:strand:+ start:2754 stop:3953 length:1200 start_codon:yes stop_codon:yes gene_type:complete
MKRLLLLAGVTLSTGALADGRLEGQVGSADGKALLKGAVVRIPELGLTATTGSDGRYVFGQVPAGTHRITITYLGFAPYDATVSVTDGGTTTQDVDFETGIEEMVVYGRMTSSAASALNQQLAADAITSVVSAEDIGALPDQNAAEALSRVPGTFLERDQGEGRYVGIRGIDPDLNTTSINGLRIPAPEDDKRAIQLDVLPSELLATLTVAKSVTPDMDGDAVGGSIDIDSVSAFDRRGRTMSFTAEGTYSDLTDDTSPRISGNFTNVYDFAGIEDGLGVAVAVSYYDRDFGSDNVENGDGWRRTGSGWTDRNSAPPRRSSSATTGSPGSGSARRSTSTSGLPTSPNTTCGPCTPRRPTRSTAWPTFSVWRTMRPTTAAPGTTAPSTAPPGTTRCSRKS